MVGDQLVVHGRLEENVWEKDGEQRTDLQIIPDSLGVSLRFGAAKTSRVLNDTGRATPEMDGAAESGVPF
jgi:single-stranded DNA-binding protein